VSSRREHAQQNGYLSVGLVVKNYWSNFVQFANKKVGVLLILVKIIEIENEAKTLTFRW